MKLERVTITGVDDKTNHSDLIEISKKYPFVEWGILFSPTRNLTGESRYPTMDWVLKLKEQTKGLNMKFSAHVCGGYTREFLDYGTSNLVNENIKKYVVNFFDRAQLNFNATKHNVNDKFYELLKNNALKHPLIIQYNKSNSEVCQKIIEQKIPVHFLYDGSGGRGVSPVQWQPPIQNHFTGYSGGLSPFNLNEKLSQIHTEVDNDYALRNKQYAEERHDFICGNGAKHYEGNFKGCPTEIWIDVETGVRTSPTNIKGDDILDLNKVSDFLEIASKYTKQ